MRGLRSMLPVLTLLALILLATPASASLVAYYKFDDSGNLGRDYGPWAASGYYTATNSGVAYNAGGYTAGAGDFDGGDDYLRLPVTGRLNALQANPYTIMAWINPNMVPPAGAADANTAHYGIINKAGYHSGLRYLGANAGANAQKVQGEGWLATGPTSYAAQSTGTAAPAAWTHTAAVVNPQAGTMTIYVNGVAGPTVNWTPGAPYNYGTGTWTIGNANPGAGTYRWPMNGRIDEAAFFDHALSPAEIASIAAGASPTTIVSGAITPTGLWRFEGAHGTPVGTVVNTLNPGFLDGVGESSASYSSYVPSRRIYDPISGTTYVNTSSLNMAPGAVRVLSDPALQAGNFTVEAFLRIGGDQGGYPAFVSHRNATPLGWQLDIDPNEALRTRFDSAAAQNQVVGGGALGTGVWNHTAVTYDSATKQIRLYRNYVNAYTGTLNGNSSDVTAIVADFLMGAGSGWPAGTYLDEVRFTPQVLDPPQFLQLLGVPVTYRITAATQTGNASVDAYVAELDTVVGNQFAGTGTGSPSVTVTGSVTLREGALDFLHIKAAGTGSAAGSAPYMAATFTTPMGYIFQETGTQYLTTNAATWSTLSDPWGNIQQVTLAPYSVGSPNPALTGHAPGTQAIWGQDENTGDAYTPTYFSTGATVIQGAWSVIGGRLDSIQQPQGLSAHIVRVNGDLNNLTDTDNALALLPNQNNHNVSQVTAVSRADLETSNTTGRGNYTNPAGFLPGAHNTAADAPGEDYAVRLAGYVYAPSDGYVRTFAVGGDDRFYFKVGDVEFARSEAVVGAPPMLAQMTFPQAGYYPIELVWANRGGAGNLEISSMDGFQTTWSAATFAILGTDPNYPVYQRPSGVPNPASAGANTVGGAVYAGGVEGRPDGFRVHQAYPASHGGANPGDAAAALAFFADKAIANGDPTQYNLGGVVALRTRLDMHDTNQAAAGNFSPTDPFPIDNFNTTYNPATNTYGSANVANNNFVTRINGLLYIDEPGTRAFTVGTDDGFYLRIGNQVLGRITGGRGIPAGTANYVYGYFPEAGLYPFEFYHYQGTGGAGLELGQGGTTNLILPITRNPADASNGFSTDWSAIAYSVAPVAKLQVYSTTLQAQAFGDVPGLGAAVNPEQWFLLRQTPNSVPGAAGLPIQGLRGTYYDFAFNQTVDNTWPPTDAPPIPVLGYRNDLNAPGSVFNFAAGFASAFVVSRPGSPTNPAGANDYFGVRWQGFINIPRTGNYNFQMQADDRAWMFIDLNGDLAFGPGESPAGQPVVWSNWMQWNNVFLTAGLHWVEFRSREWSGGETATFQWMMPEGGAFANIPAEYFINIQGWEVLAYGSGAVGDLANFADLMTFDFGSTQTLRLVTQIAGLTAYYEGTFTFVPEPGTLLLLAGGLLGAATRRRRNRR